MPYFAFQHPGKGLQIGMRMRTDLQAVRTFGKFGGACVVEKTPSADGAAFTLRNQAGNGDAADVFDAGGEGFGVHVVCSLCLMVCCEVR